MSPEEIAIFIKLVGAREFALAAGVAGASLDEVAASADVTGRSFDGVTRRSYIMNQALFTVRRLMYGTTLALIGGGVAAVALGWKFNNAMQQARVALTPVFSTTRALNKELDYLFNFTKYTPFQFKDVTTAFRVMYGSLRTVGVSVQGVNLDIKAMTDALAYSGKTSPGQLNRVSTAIQHMALLGHVTGQIVNQLNRDGLPFSAALRKELGLTGDQMERVGALGITTQQGLAALNKYIETTPGYAGAAYRLATQSLSGLFTTFKDDLSQIMGAIEIGFFSRVQGRIVNMNKWFDQFSTKLRANKGDIGATLGSIDPNYERIWNVLASDVHWFFLNIWNVINALRTSKPLWAAIYGSLLLLHGVLLAISPLTAGFGGTLNVIIPLLVVWYTVTKAAAIADWLLVAAQTALNIELIVSKNGVKDLTFAQFVALGVTRAWAAATRLLAVAQGLWTVASLGYAKGATGQFRAMTTMEKFALKLRVGILGLAAATQAWAIALWESTAAIWANPITWIVAGISALTVGLVVLYFKWGAFHDAVNKTAQFIIRYAPLIGAALTVAFGPIGAAIAGLLLVIKYWQQIKQILPHNTGDAKNPIAKAVAAGNQGHRPTVGGKGFWDALITPLINIPSFATGGTMPYSGIALVGERGPELVYLGAGSTVTQVPSYPAQPVNYGPAQRQHPEGRPYRIQVVVDKKILGQVTAQQIASQMARQ